MKRLVVPLIVASLLCIMFGQMLAEAWLDGGSSDEQIHILSGYATITQAHVLFDPEHPFLAKALAAIPLLWVQPAVPFAAANLRPDQALSTYNTYREANQWAYEMVFTSGNDPDQLLFLTRAVIALLTVLLAGVIYWWTKNLWGTASALAALTLVAFEPSIIAHGHLSNDDTVATLFFIGSLAAFHQWLKTPSRRNTIVTGLVLGLGLITKYSLLLLGPTFLLLTVGWLVFETQKRSSPEFSFRLPHVLKTSNLKILISRFKASDWKRYALGLLSVFLIAWAVIWIAYGSLILINPAQNPTKIIPIDQFTEPYASIAPYVLPVMYEKGAALLFDPNSHGRDGYLLGACYKGGRVDYFALMTLFKTPLPTLLLFGITCVLWYRQRGQNKYVPVIILVSLLIYLAISSLSKINIGYRHVLPVGTLILIAAAYPFSQVNWRQTATDFRSHITKIFQQLFRSKQSNQQEISSLLNGAVRQLAYPSILILLLAASAISGALAFPNHLSYFNILSGEPRNKPFISADSNVDWGQGTKSLHRYMQEHDIDHVAFDNFTGTAEAEARGYAISPANPDNHDYRGYIALSRSTIIDHYCTKGNDWGWLVDHHQPVHILDGSINIYKLD